MSQPSFASRALLVAAVFGILYQIAYGQRPSGAAVFPAAGAGRPRRSRADDRLHPFAREPKPDNAGVIDVAAEPRDRGRDAEAPSEMSAAGWKDILIRTYQSIPGDRVFALAAGVTYYVLLSLFPALTALVSIFGLFGDTRVIEAQIDSLAGIIPADALGIIHEQLDRLAAQGEATLGLAFILGLATSLWTANAGVKAMFDALNVVYGERERRGFVRLNLLSLLFTVGLLVFTLFALGAVVILPTMLNLLFLGGDTEWLIALLRWPALLVVVVLGLSVIYRYGPSRADPKWRWVSWGGAAAASLWLIVSMLFSWYVANFGNYNETYGSLGAVIGFMVWVWLSVSVVLLGGELNAEMEHQTARDTTTGTPLPLGMRGAEMADTVGAAQD